ncbi:MAG: hypothetical protein ACPHRO_11575, partial [Nannocystaceae bacterium]
MQGLGSLAPAEDLRREPGGSGDEEKGGGARWGLPLVMLTVLLAHVTSLANEFLNFDDRALFVKNPLLRRDDLSAVWEILSLERENWRPLRDLSHWLDHLVHGQSPFWSHAHNLVLLLLCVVVVSRFLERLGGSRAHALWATALGFVHPVQVETIAWVTGRKDLLACIFGVTAWSCFARALDASRPLRWAVTGVGCTALGIMAKGHLVVMPALFLGLALFPPARAKSALRSRRVIAIFVVLVVMSACAVPLIARGPVVLRADLLEYGDRFRLTVGDRVQLPWLYVSKFVWPANLSPVYDPLPLGPTHQVYVIFGGVVFFGWLMLLARWFRASDRRFVPLFFSLVLLLPHVHLVPGTVFMANRYLFVIAPLWSWVLVDSLARVVRTPRL